MKKDELRIKQENFCQKYIETGNASEAYRFAYNCKNMKPATVNRNAKALLDNNKIATRIAELRAKHQEAHDVTVESLTKELERARELAEKNGKISAVVSAIMGKAKLHGLLIDKPPHVVVETYESMVERLAREQSEGK